MRPGLFYSREGTTVNQFDSEHSLLKTLNSNMVHNILSKPYLWYFQADTSIFLLNVFLHITSKTTEAILRANKGGTAFPTW